MTQVASYVKAATAVLDFTIDWSSWLGTDTISTSTWSVPTGITKNSDTKTTTTTTAWMSGGTAGQTYVLTNTIVTAGGRTDARQIEIVIDPVRAGMANLIRELRTLCNAGSADYTINGEAYFSDAQLQDELDAKLQIIRSSPLVPVTQRSGAAYVYKEFAANVPYYFIEEDGAGTGGWAVRDGAGVAKTIITDYSVNYRAGLITFVADQVASPNFWLDCRCYDLYHAAAAVWRIKAGLESRSVDFSQAQTRVQASQRRDYCLQMALEMERKGGVRAVKMVRGDEL